ncbi:phosphoglycolate phosphatase [soil metagenome]
MRSPHAALLFDFDGTLADTAADLSAAVNAMLVARGLAALPLDALRPWASHGTRGLVGAAFGIRPGDADYDAFKDEFLQRYESKLCVETQIFPALEPLLARCERIGLPWGIVTNKGKRFTEPLIDAMGLRSRIAVVVSGDTTPHAKPHAAPLLHAAKVIGIDPALCVYVGDDERDILAGRAAGMRTIAVDWGYSANQSPASWNADALAERPEDLETVLNRWKFFAAYPS